MSFANVVVWKLKKVILRNGSLDKSVSSTKSISLYPKAIPRKEYWSHGTKWYSYMSIDQMIAYYKESELTTTLRTEIKEKYPSAQEVDISFYNYEGFYYCDKCSDKEMKITISVKWYDGITQALMSDLIETICQAHFKNIPEYENEHYNNGVQTLIWRIHPLRSFSDDVVLRAARIYADCISQGLPINKDNIKHLMLGKVSLYDLAVGDLQNINL